MEEKCTKPTIKVSFEISEAFKVFFECSSLTTMDNQLSLYGQSMVTPNNVHDGLPLFEVITELIFVNFVR